MPQAAHKTRHPAKVVDSFLKRFGHDGSYVVGKIVNESCVDNALRRNCTAVRLGTRGNQRLGRGLRAGEAKHLVTRTT